MKKNYLLSYLIAATFFVFFFTSNNVQAAETDLSELKPYVKVFDENNELIKEYSDSEIESLISNYSSISNTKSLSTLSTDSMYNFGKTTFSNNVWIKSGSTFYNPLSVGVTTNTKFERLIIRIFSSSGKETGSVAVGGFLGGLDIPVSHLYSSDGSYKIQLYNGSSSYPVTPITLESGYVYY